MEIAQCKDCNRPLVSKVEAKLTRCFECMVKINLEFDSLKESSLSNQGEIKESGIKLERATDLFEKFQRMMSAENVGKQASNNGFDASQNPFDDEQLKAMWMNGWQSEEVRREAAQAVSVLKWSIQNLKHIEELALGYNQHEIATKVNFLLSKLEGFYSDEDT